MSGLRGFIEDAIDAGLFQPFNVLPVAPFSRLP